MRSSVLGWVAKKTTCSGLSDASRSSSSASQMRGACSGSYPAFAMVVKPTSSASRSWSRENDRMLAMAARLASEPA